MNEIVEGFLNMVVMVFTAKLENALPQNYPLELCKLITNALKLNCESSELF